MKCVLKALCMLTVVALVFLASGLRAEAGDGLAKEPTDGYAWKWDCNGANESGEGSEQCGGVEAGDETPEGMCRCADGDPDVDTPQIDNWDIKT